jgi:hypothetical protein
MVRRAPRERWFSCSSSLKDMGSLSQESFKVLSHPLIPWIWEAEKPFTYR